MSKAKFLEENLRTGEIYAGLILGKDGQPDYHVVLLAAKPDQDMNWAAAKAWAIAAGGELPTRREQSVLFANCREHFDSAWYWSGEQHARYDDYAWMQYFYDGLQNFNRKAYEYRARAVRRLLIIE